MTLARFWPSARHVIESASRACARERGEILPKANIEQLALEALSRALVDPAAKVLFGSKSKPGIFDGAGQAFKQAAQLCLDRGWLEGTGQFEGKGKTRKELF